MVKCEFYSEIFFKLKLNLLLDFTVWYVDLSQHKLLVSRIQNSKISFCNHFSFYVINIFGDQNQVIDSLLDVQVWIPTYIKNVQVYSEKKMMHVNLCFVHSQDLKLSAKSWWSWIKRLLKSNLNQINLLISWMLSKIGRKFCFVGKIASLSVVLCC